MGEIIKTIPVMKGMQSTVNVVFAENPNVITPKNNAVQITQAISIPDNIVAPVFKGQKLGEAVYCLDGVVLNTVDIIAETEIKKMSFFNMSSSLYKSWFCLMRQ